MSVAAEGALVAMKGSYCFGLWRGGETLLVGLGLLLADW